MIKVLFVCMGNICRSPLAEGSFTQLVKNQGLSASIKVDSAATHSYHISEPPDPRGIGTAAGRGIDISAQRARQVRARDFKDFDYVLAMDRDNIASLRVLCPSGLEHKLSLFLDFAPGNSATEVPDPYYGGRDGFDHVLDLVQTGSEGLLGDIRGRYALK